MALILKDRFPIFKRDFNIELLKKRLIVVLKKQCDDVQCDYQGNISWNNTSLFSLRRIFVFGRMSGTKGKIIFHHNQRGGWSLNIEIDVTYMALTSIIFTVGFVLITSRSQFKNVFGILSVAFMAAVGILGVNTAKKWIIQIIQKEVATFTGDPDNERAFDTIYDKCRHYVEVIKGSKVHSQIKDSLNALYAECSLNEINAHKLRSILDNLFILLTSPDHRTSGNLRMVNLFVIECYTGWQWRLSQLPEPYLQVIDAIKEMGDTIDRLEYKSRPEEILQMIKILPG